MYQLGHAVPVNSACTQTCSCRKNTLAPSANEFFMLCAGSLMKALMLIFVTSAWAWIQPQKSIVQRRRKVQKKPSKHVLRVGVRIIRDGTLKIPRTIRNVLRNQIKLIYNH